MENRFHELPAEKRRQIVSAALEVFGREEYRRASTDEIAARAGISKGLLFYYFRSKKELYLFLIHLIEKTLVRLVADEEFYGITDFFELLRYTARKKVAIFRKNPHMLAFSLRSYYSVKEDVSDAMQQATLTVMDHMDVFFKNIDVSPFREGKSPEEALQTLIWLADGYLHQLQMRRQRLDIDEFLRRYDGWIRMVRREFYREDCLHEQDSTGH